MPACRPSTWGRNKLCFTGSVYNSAIEESSRAFEEKKYALILTALSFSNFLCIHEAAIDALHSLLDRTGERTEAASYS